MDFLHMASLDCQCISRSRVTAVDPQAQPAIVASRSAAVLVDDADGMAYPAPACALAVATVIERA
jgi:(2R)-3-sulfolactate dehydrogenase (NADP+)